MTTIIYDKEFQEDIAKLKLKSQIMTAMGQDTTKIDKQLAILEDAVVIYKLPSPSRE